MIRQIAQALLVTKVSKVSLPFHVETRTDAYRTIRTESARQAYIADYGDVVVAYDTEWKVYRVPAFQADIERYTAAKMRECEIWGSE